MMNSVTVIGLGRIELKRLRERLTHLLAILEEAADDAEPSPPVSGRPPWIFAKPPKASS